MRRYIKYNVHIDYVTYKDFKTERFYGIQAESMDKAKEEATREFWVLHQDDPCTQIYSWSVYELNK